METEQDRLGLLYGEMGDEHLRDLASEPENLTDEARLVLGNEMRRRGFAPQVLNAEDKPIVVTEAGEREEGFGPGIPGMFPAGAVMMEQALEPESESRDGLSRLIAFYDGLELSKACGLLEDAEMEPVIEAIDGDAQSSVPPRYELWLATEDIEQAKRLLRERMGLFPLAEVGGDEHAEFEPTGMVGVFETESEANEVHTMLAGAGFHAQTERGEEDGDWEVWVAPEEQERAVAAVASGMGIR